MPYKKLTDSEIVKALEDVLHRINGATRICVPQKSIEEFYNVLQDALELITRLQAENEGLKEQIKVGDKIYEDTCNKFDNDLKTAKAEAYKEFAERLEAEYTDFDEENEVILPENLNKAINDLLKELVGEDDG